jgi:hypothetical protein
MKPVGCVMLRHPLCCFSILVLSSMLGWYYNLFLVKASFTGFTNESTGRYTTPHSPQYCPY